MIAPECKVAAEILDIMHTYHEQDDGDGVDTPGGLEHMGDVWRLLLKWEKMLLSENDAAAQLEAPNDPVK